MWPMYMAVSVPQIWQRVLSPRIDTKCLGCASPPWMSSLASSLVFEIPVCVYCKLFRVACPLPQLQNRCRWPNHPYPKALWMLWPIGTGLSIDHWPNQWAFWKTGTCLWDMRTRKGINLKAVVSYYTCILIYKIWFLLGAKMQKMIICYRSSMSFCGDPVH